MYIADEARGAILNLTGTPVAAFILTAPLVEKSYWIRNATGQQATIKTASGVGAVVRAGRLSFVFCDGTDFYAADPSLDQIKTAAADLNLGGFKVTNQGAGTNPTDGATLSNRLDQFAAPTASVSAGNQRITNLGTTGADTDAINRGEVNSLTAASVAAAAASASSASTSATLAQSWATVTGSLVASTDYSSKEYAIGTTATLGSSKSWATITGSLVGGVDYSAREYATGTFVPAGSAKTWATSTTIITGGFKGALGYAQDAATSATAAAASYDSFDDRYLGPKAADPTLDNDGAALLTGALYFNTTAGEMRAYSGTAWVAAYVTAGTFVAGPASATADAIALFNGTGGKTIKDSGFLFGTSSDFWANTANRLSTNATIWTAQAFVTITYAATTTPNMSTFLNGTITLTGNLTLANPTNAKAGQSGFIRLVQDATGSRTVTFGSAWKFNGGPPTASTAANSVDAISYVVVDAATPVLNCAFLKAIA